ALQSYPMYLASTNLTYGFSNTLLHEWCRPCERYMSSMRKIHLYRTKCTEPTSVYGACDISMRPSNL
ncbi:hypothetical protein MKW98_028114, partial [Papaver atlanticum]